MLGGVPVLGGVAMVGGVPVLGGVAMVGGVPMFGGVAGSWVAGPAPRGCRRRPTAAGDASAVTRVEPAVQTRPGNDHDQQGTYGQGGDHGGHIPRAGC
ncbi:hypothetical protein [Streptomyces sp. NPDC088794]|uniref:hypothetical protein n=1 Tax=Streptomyces sp. NPDC088794 TaxID=3365902 RepID=UPI0038306938